jgi:aminoglycoside/choline kinase family phosphotransferase
MTIPGQQATEDVGFRERIDRYLRDNRMGGPGVTIVPLTGDASDRRYFRIIGSDGRSIVLALHVGPIDFAALPFANAAELFQRLALPVPAVLGHSDPLGIVALEDLGDVTLQAHLGAATADEHAALYDQAVEFIEQLQRRGTQCDGRAFIAYGIAFDVEKLTWELEFFTRHFIEGYRGAALSPAHREALNDEWSSIARELAAEPRVLCHRDYHSRNLMLHAGRLYLIDFQDARMGPDTYDLVSLLRDSYVDLPDDQVARLTIHFLDLKDRDAGTGVDRETRLAEFRRRFDLMAVQRNLKALGTFGYQTITRRNPVYIQYMPRTLRYVRTNLDRYPRFARLRELLAEYVEELR